MPSRFASSSPAYERELRFIVQTGGPPDRVLQSARAVLGGSAEAEPLFPGADERNSIRTMADFHLIRLPGVSFRDLETNPYDIARTLRDSGEHVIVTPDFPRRPELGATAFADVCAINGVEGYGRWSPGAISLTEAWDRLISASAGLGRGVSIAHLDTGLKPHIAIDQGRIDRARSLNILAGGTDTTDPLHTGLLLNPGHGTETAAVALGNNLAQLTGIAPEATLVDVRCTDSVVLFFNTDIARAIWHATSVGADIITMSLGGTPELCTEIALINAAHHNQIVVTAAGNCVPFVTFPASSAYSLGIAASNILSRPWMNDLGGPGSSFGAKVDVSAPGQDIEVPAVTDSQNPTTQFRSGRGTSFAVAAVAGLAALWVAYRRVVAPGSISPAAFRNVLRATTVTPSGWDTELFGTGIINADALIQSNAGSGGATPESHRLDPKPQLWLSSSLSCTTDRAEQVLNLLFGSSSEALGIDKIPLITELTRQLVDRPVVGRQISSAVRRGSLTTDRLRACILPIIEDPSPATRFSQYFCEFLKL